MDLVSYTRSRMNPLLPVTTGIASKLGKAEGIRIVAFDLYGTLLVSTAGDITAEKDESEMRKAMGLVFAHLDVDCRPGMIGSALRSFQQLQTQTHEEIRARGIVHSELDIRLVWRRLFKNELGRSLTELQIDEVALIYECEMNPVWEMPGVVEVLDTLALLGIRLGVISNAQNYTHNVFAGVSGRDLLSFGIEPLLSVFSFEVGEGKPSLTLYEQFAEAAASLGIRPSEILYVGNDVRKDIIPAQTIGFRTVLFAGDQRSIRFGELEPEDAFALSDFVVTDLNQILDII